MDSMEPGSLGFASLDLHRQVSRLLALENAIDVARRAPILIIATGDQPPARSQAHAGWSLLRAKSEDGGFSGGNTYRPALRRLLDDVRAGKLDVIVVDSSKSSPNSARALARGGIDGLLVRGTDTGVRQQLRFVNVCR
jgi:hypothetical protein